MSEVLWQWIGVLVLGAGGLLLLTTTWRWPRRRHGCFCPGPRRPWYAWVAPWALLDRRGCFYDLASLQTRTDLGVSCPECGTCVRPWRMLHLPGRVRWGRVALALVVGAALLVRHAQRVHGHWTAALPSSALLAIKWARGPLVPEAVGRDIDRRLEADTLWGWERVVLSRLLVEDLTADLIDLNAVDALRQLRTLGPDALVALENALHADDSQQRQLAAQLLWEQDYPPTDALLRVTLDGLRDNAFRGYRRAGNAVARGGIRFLTRHRTVIEPYLRRGLVEGDEKQRLLCAVVASLARQRDLLDVAAPILIGHLRDNRRRDDAKYAATALRHFGPAVRKWLLPWRSSTDPQQRKYVEMILVVLDEYGDDHFSAHGRGRDFLCELH